MKRLKMILAFFAMLCIALASSPADAKNDVYIIVNANNPTTQLTRAELIKIFKGTKKTWDGRSNIVPVVQKSEVEGFFDLMDTTKSKYDKYWIKRCLSGKGTPLNSLYGDSGVVRYVRGDRNSIGYVTSKNDLQGVKVVNIIR